MDLLKKIWVQPCVSLVLLSFLNGGFFEHQGHAEDLTSFPQAPVSLIPPPLPEDCNNLKQQLDEALNMWNQHTDSLALFMGEAGTRLSQWYDELSKKRPGLCQAGPPQDPFSEIAQGARVFQEVSDLVYENSNIVLERINHIADCLEKSHASIKNRN